SSELNIVWDPEVEGQKTSLAVKDIPWDQLLDIVVQQKGYKAMVMGNVVRIMPIETFNKQAEAKKKEIALSDELEAVIMSVIPVSLSQAEDVRTMINALMQDKSSMASSSSDKTTTSTKSDGSGGTTSITTKGGEESELKQDFKRGRIEVDKRTNSLVVTNTKD